MRDQVHEVALVEAFIRDELKERYLTLLAHKRRSRITARLASARDFDSRFCRRLTTDEQHHKHLLDLLRKYGAPSRVYLISRDAPMDTEKLDLAEALTYVVGACAGTLISCIPGKLAVLETENANERFLLHRP